MLGLGLEGVQLHPNSSVHASSASSTSKSLSVELLADTMKPALVVSFSSTNGAIIDIVTSKVSEPSGATSVK